MAYSSQTDLENAVEAALLIQLTDDEATGSINATRLARAIADADSVIDGHIRSRYDVPLVETPALIRKLSVDLAIFNLFSRRGSHFELPDWVVQKHKDAMAMLKDMRDGKMDLGVEPPPTISTAEVATSNGPDRLFTEDTLEYF